MPPSIAILPLELLITVVSFLNLEDVVNLKMTGKELWRILHNESISKEIVKRLIGHSKEGRLADRQSISYVTAIQRTFCRREAFALARPCSALILGRSTSLVYREGVLCYMDWGWIRILNVHQAASVEQVIDLELMGKHIWKGGKPLSRAKLLHYQDGVLSFLYRSPLSNGQYESEEIWLVAINVRDHTPVPKRVQLAMMVQNAKFFVRNDSQYLYVGSHDGIGSHGHHEWVLQGYRLSNGQPMPSLQLPDLFGTDLRQTLVFEVYDGFLYAISNQSSFEVEEIDWTSYYHCHRFPLDHPTSEYLQQKQIFRRQHLEGPINDSWTDLGLHQDERTGDLLITECRREWKDGQSTQRRTYYSEPLVFSDPRDLDTLMSPSFLPLAPSPSATSPMCSASHPPDHPLNKLIGEKDRPLYSEPVPRIPRNYHLEPSTPARSFILAKTKYHTSIPASSAFLDLVLDDYPPRNATPQLLPPRHWAQQLRLRLGSRVQASPIDPATHLLHKPSPAEIPLPDSEERFRDRDITLWPPADAPAELLDLLNPAFVPSVSSRVVGDVVAIADERSLAYMPAAMGRPEGETRNVVLVNFDPGVRFEGLPLLRGAAAAAAARSDEEAREVVMRDDRGKGMDDAGGSERGGGTEAEKEEDDDDDDDVEEERERRGWWWEERAMHLVLGKGFRFKWPLT